MSLDIEYLLKALDNDDNTSVIKLNHTIVNRQKNDMLQRSGLDRNTLIKYNKSLKQYRYIDDVSEIRFGAYVRWIPLLNPNNITLLNGGFICDVKINSDVIVVCKNRFNNIFEFKMSNCLVFQKLSDEEKILLSAMEYLNN